jgi:hypothetical protein
MNTKQKALSAGRLDGNSKQAIGLVTIPASSTTLSKRRVWECRPEWASPPPPCDWMLLRTSYITGETPPQSTSSKRRSYMMQMNSMRPEDFSNNNVGNKANTQQRSQKPEEYAELLGMHISLDLWC